MRISKKYLGLAAALVFLGFASPSAADVNDFSFSSFEATYDLSINKAKDNRPEMWVTERLVANFPETDQNHGIRRSIPELSYGKYPGLISEIEVTDENEQPREFEINIENGFVDLAIKPSDDSYVHGEQVYFIKYHQSWVINNYQSTSGFDEFYWDVNGTGWLQSFDKVTATVTVDETLAKNLFSENISCYQGVQGSKEPCAKASITDGQIFFSSGKLEAGENLTIAIPFQPNVANTTGPIVTGTLNWYGFWVCLGLAVLVILWAIYFRIFGIKSASKRSFLVPQYKPAAEPGLLTSALVIRKTAHLYQASVVELAVLKLIEIEVVPDSNNKDFILRRTKLAATNSDHVSLLDQLGLTASGSELLLAHNMPAKLRNELSKGLLTLRAAASKRISSAGYFQKRALGVPTIGFATGLVVYVAWMYFAIGLDTEVEQGYVSAPLLSFFLFVSSYWILLSKRALTNKGAELESYVKGLESYIQLAEKDRLEFLQSPSGASLKPSEVQGKQVLKLYEEVLPWAILLGLQKQWSKVLTDLYESQGTPIWFIGSPHLADSFSNLDQVLTQSLAASSSGGSDGGGSSGGGGGGGGGGGI